MKSTLYTRDPSDTVESVSDELVTALGKSIVKQLKAEKTAQPIQRVALLYSAEHAHCGLPANVLLAPASEGDLNPLDWEAYSHEASWPPVARIGKKIESLHRRILVVVDGSEKYAHEDAPKPYRDVLWRVSRDVYEALVNKKRIVSEDFAVFPLDDHGDVDAAEDVRQSLPSDVAKQVIAKAES